jgi:Ca2+/Na+ antiporter
MRNNIVRHIRILTVTLSAVLLIAVGSIYRLGFLSIAFGAAFILLFGVYVWKRSQTPTTPKQTFGIFVRGSLIFFCGAAYGTVLWWRDGRPWIDVLGVMWPLAIAGYLLHFAYRSRRKAATSPGDSPRA